MRIMMQPAAISGAVEKPISSAPSSAATTTSRPVRKPPSTWTATRPRSPFGDQGLLGLGQADLPWAAGMLDRGQRRGAGAPFIARDGDVVGPGLGDAGRDRADADLGNELDRDRGLRVDVLEIEDQLGQILDRVDVVMRRRRDQPDAGCRVTDAGDGGVDLVAGQLAAFARLGPLRHLDLPIRSAFTRYSVVTPNRPEATCLMAERIELPLGSGRNRSGSSPPSPVFDLPPMRFMAMASVVWASRLIEPKDMAPVAKRRTMAAGRLDLVERHGVAPHLGRILDPEQAAQGLVAGCLLVDQPGESSPNARALLPRTACCSSATVSGVQICCLAADAVGIIAADIEGVGDRADCRRRLRHGGGTPPRRSREADAFDLLAVPVKYLRTKALERPMASKICAPQ